ncbi:MAG: hypothetical protein EB060_01745 [Proteobacteria bacterium]|nr:hypothetical protein [Pseudomonadota bacterium]
MRQQELMLEKIVHYLRVIHSSSKELWTAQDIADYVSLKKKTVQNSIITKPTFPAPVLLATGGKRWKAKEVKAWQEKQRLAK